MTTTRRVEILPQVPERHPPGLLMSIFKVPKSEMDRLEDAIRNHPRLNDAGEVDRLFIEFQPLMKRLASGEALEAQLKKLLYAGNPDRALKLLRAHGGRRRIGFGGTATKAMVSLVLIPLAILFLGTAMPRCDGTHDLAFETINQCPGAVERLGPGIEQSLVGWSCGQSESGGGWGHASWSVPVKGQLGSGRYEYAGEMHGGRWQLTRATLEVNDEEISILHCWK